jgi:hypothetical protein
LDRMDFLCPLKSHPYFALQFLYHIDLKNNPFLYNLDVVEDLPPATGTCET